MSRSLVLCSAFSVLVGCSEYDLVAPETPADGVITEEEAPPINDDSAPTDAPIAICSTDRTEVRPPTERNTFIGSESYDPADVGIASWDWTIVSAPVGSAANLTGTGTDRGFTADQAGIYTAQLIVTTTDNRVSEPCLTEVNAIPAEALWVEMFWVNSGDDMDLHLLRPGGAPRGEGDCYYANCDGGYGPDWGNNGQASDDPSLDLDDISGTGPENINIGSPEFGTFTVFVHDYPGSVYSGGNAVTVNIYIDGQLEWTDTRTISGEDSDTYFAEVDWPTAQIRSR